MHTTFSDGRDAVRAMVEAARVRGVSCVALTDHVRRDTDWFPRYVDEVRRVAHDFPELKVYVGLEAKALDFDGTLDATDEMLELADFVLGAVHRYPDGRGGVRDFAHVTAEEGQRLEVEATIGLIRNPTVSAIAHPGGTFSRRYGSFPEVLRRQLFEAARRYDKPLEVSAKYEPGVKRALRLHQEYGVRFTLGSDAHAASEVGLVLDALVKAGLAC
jgi:putative hydrolase